MAAKAMILAKKMATAMTAALKCDGFNIVQNNGECAGQTVFHFHMHLIPRYKGDQVGITWHPGELNDADKEEILLKVRSSCPDILIQHITKDGKYRFCKYLQEIPLSAFNIGKFILGDEDEAEDVCQDVFETLFHMGRSVDFSDEKKLENLIVRISYHKHPIIAKRPSGNMNMRIQMRFWKYRYAGKKR